MLGRAVVPLLRPRKFPPAVRLTTLHQTRYYARDRKSRPSDDYKLPASAPKPSWQQAPHNASPTTDPALSPQRPSQAQESTNSEYSDLQPEFESSSNAPKNTPETSEELRATSRNHTEDSPLCRLQIHRKKEHSLSTRAPSIQRGTASLTRSPMKT